MPDKPEIREWRSKKEISQSQLSELVDIDQGKLSRWELGKEPVPEPQLETIRQCLDGLSEDEIAELNQRTILHGGEQNHAESPRTTAEHERARDTGAAADSSSSRYPIEWIADELNRETAPDTGRTAIALFAGAGGLSLGFELAGFDIVGYVEQDEAIRKIYDANFEDAECLGHDIRDVTAEDVREWRDAFGDIDVVIGGPPCQGFSLAGKRDVEDDRNRLFEPYARIISHLEPEAFLMENVGKLTSMESPDGGRVVSEIVDEFASIGYDADYAELDAKHYGVPQSRNRVIFVGLREDLDAQITFPDPTHASLDSGVQATLGGAHDRSLRPYETFRSATADLERLGPGEAAEEDPWHFAVDHPDHVVRWLEDVPAGHSAHENDDPELRPNSGYNTTYKRIEWDEPSSTVTRTFGMISGTRNVHPEDTRSFTVREAMRCQTFPDTFEVFGNLTDVRNGIGNAVPPLFAKRLAEHLREEYFRDGPGSG